MSKAKHIKDFYVIDMFPLINISQVQHRPISVVVNVKPSIDNNSSVRWAESVEIGPYFEAIFLYFEAVIRGCI